MNTTITNDPLSAYLDKRVDALQTDLDDCAASVTELQMLRDEAVPNGITIDERLLAHLYELDKALRRTMRDDAVRIREVHKLRVFAEHRTVIAMVRNPPPAA